MILNQDRSLAITYGFMSFCIIILHNIFLLFHIEIFLNIYKIDKTSFWIAEFIFLLWNSCNDTLFGWLSDKRYLSSSKFTQLDIINNRLSILLYSGPLFAISFLIFWFSWTSPLLQLIICLCLYDTFLTQLDLQHSALLADLTFSLELRTCLNRYCSIFGVLASGSAFISFFIWNINGNLLLFRLVCIMFTILSIFGFCLSNIKLKHHVNKFRNLSFKTHMSIDNSKKGIFKFIFEVLNQKNLILFSLMNLIQVFHCHFNSNFFPLFLNILLGKTSTLSCSIILGLSFLLPHINNIYFSSLCNRYGSYEIINILFFVKFSLSFIMIYIGCDNIWIMSFFIASNRVFTEGICKLLNLVVSDLVDEDVVIHNRPQAVSALIFGVIAFLSKPGQTLAPVIGTLLLSYYTGKEVFSERSNLFSPIENFMKPVLSMEDGRTIKNGCFHLIVFVPTACALFQLVIWHNFTLHGRKLLDIKSLRTGFKMTTI